MRIEQLKYAIAISESGSINKASEILYIAQPSLTSSVQELERELGITIFHRTSRGVTPTNDGVEFIQHARQVVQQYDTLAEKYGEAGKLKKKFGISTQHYSFAVKGFVDMVKQFDTGEYEFALRETKTREVIEDVISGKSEVGVLYVSDFNRKALEKFFRNGNLQFYPLIRCDAYVYLWREHPLAKKKSICFAELEEYPCLSFEQGAEGSFYFAEEIMSTNEYRRTIKATDRATMLNLMVGLGGYTLCSGIISEEVNGPDFVTVPFVWDEQQNAEEMEIGYIVRKNTILSGMAELYIQAIKKYLKGKEKTHGK